ncbi:azurin [Fodinibius roseus]|uniref:Azurin n=1 Tax=Fodinibius roseus TaxID=1194090 RepID=A0A1M5EJH5_9BACT|nr:plastocyanin/azurin family copper-binding protein [Fodinibius roseus]SHF79357.1 azurin [Fodinibius roseus]
MRYLTYLLPLMFFITTACGGGSGDQQQQADETTTEAQSSAADQSGVRTIEIIGIDQMKFAVESDEDGISTGGETGDYLLLESISAEPGEEIRVVLTTESDLPATAMAHNFVLLTLSADVDAFVNAASQAKDNDYIPADMSDQIIAHTELAGGGETVEVTFTAPEETGEYEYVCSFPGHYAAGMRGTLNVE